jgi:hypothetical protein
MRTNNPIFSEEFCLNERVARQIFEAIPKDGPLVVLKDREGNFWPSSSNWFSELAIEKNYFKHLEEKIDDGQEPLIAHRSDFTIIGRQLTTDRTNCGYGFIILDKSSPESAIFNIELVEMLLSQMEIIAKLIEKNTLLYELRMRSFPGSPENIKTEISAN